MATPTSKEALSSLSLGHLKIDPITSIDPPDEDSKAAQAAAKWYDQARRTVLEDHPWKFAQKRTTIMAESTGPLFEYDYKFELPSDYIRMVRIGENWDDPEVDYEIEDGYILTNTAGPLMLVYIYNLTTVSKFSPKFITALSYKHAELMAYELTGNAGMKSAMLDLYTGEFTTAAAVSGQNRPIKRVQRSRLANARFGGRSNNGSSGGQ